MSPVSRGRKAKRRKSSGRRNARPLINDTSDRCDCPACARPDFDPRQLIDGLLTVAADLIESDDPLDAEYLGATFMSMGAPDLARFADVMIDDFIPEFEARASAESLAMLLAIGSITEGRARLAASAAVDRLVRAGVPTPPWAAALRAPVTVGDCFRLTDSQDSASMMVCTFHRAGLSHAVLIGVDHLDCGAADEILAFDVDLLPGALEVIRANGRADGLEIRTEAVDPAEFRWQIEQALDARAVHDSPLSGEELQAPWTEEEGPGYHAMAVLMRARMETLPRSGRSPAPHEGVLSPLEMPAMAGGAARMIGPRKVKPASARALMDALPARRRKSDPPAPVYQIKVALRGAKPPIWRRLEVPADIGLARLHTVLQIAFGWDNSHLYVFETPFGDFGDPDSRLGHRSDVGVTLEQVAPAVKSKLRYTYDLGDDWEHDILVEKVLDRTGTVSLPRCTGGRRAAPPEDCGGIPGYADLVEVLRDPADREHEDMLGWLGLDDAAEFDTETFDAGAVTRELSQVS